MKTLVLIRHGATPCTMKGVLCGRHDPDLVPEALAAARRTACHPALAGADLVATSPARRARSTASCLFGETVAPRVDERLHEIDFGDWDGLDPAGLSDRLEYRSWLDDPVAHAPPGGETAAAARDRLVDAVDEYLRSAERIVLVSHKGAIRLIASHYSGLPIQDYRSLAPVPACSVTLVGIDGDGGRLLALGDTRHLGSDLVLGAY
jgi:broad specificity phosphatase PhoE